MIAAVVRSAVMALVVGLAIIVLATVLAFGLALTTESSASLLGIASAEHETTDDGFGVEVGFGPLVPAILVGAPVVGAVVAARRAGGASESTEVS
ncbi:MAG: hypothetical protein ACLFRV_14795 [Acidimicrobiales bacterium]